MQNRASDRVRQDTENGSVASVDGVRPPRALPPWLAEIQERLRNRPSLWDRLTEEDREFLRNYDGPEVIGPPPPPPMKRRLRRRGED